MENTTQDANSIKIPMVLHYVDGDYNTSHLPEYWRDAVIMNVGHSESYYMQLAFHTSANILAIRYFRYGANFSNWRTIYNHFSTQLGDHPPKNLFLVYIFPELHAINTNDLKFKSFVHGIPTIKSP